MSWREVHPNNIGKFAPVIDWSKGMVFPDTPPYGVEECPSREDQKRLRSVKYYADNFDFTHIDHEITLSVGRFASQTFTIREDKQRFFDENRLFVAPRRSGLFYGAHEIDFVPGEPEERDKLLHLLFNDTCAAWEPLHVEYEARFAEWRETEIERRRRAWDEMNHRIRTEQLELALGIRRSN